MKSLILTLLSAYIIVTFIVYIFQRNLLYFPTAYSKALNADEIYFEVNNTKLQGWVINKGYDKALIYYGGNAEAIQDNSEYFSKLFKNTTVYMVNYRAYGKSEGEANQKVIYEDALKVFDEIKQNHKTISLMGRSLGSGVASYVASKKDIEKLILITPYDSILNVAKEAYSFLPVALLLKDRYESTRYVPSIKAKTLIIYASEDEVINPKRTQNLIDSFNKELLEVYLINGANHNDISIYQEYTKVIDEFMN